jgi:hypothetical protein
LALFDQWVKVLLHGSVPFPKRGTMLDDLRKGYGTLQPQVSKPFLIYREISFETNKIN